MKSTILDIAGDLKARKLEALKEIFSAKTPESYFIDFKKTEIQDYTNQKTLSNSDRKNFGKAISGFGNTEGGIVIWGIDTDSTDIPSAFKPIKSPETFVSLLNKQVSRITIPQVNKVENFCIKDQDKSDSGYVITAIPKYEGLPIQVIEGQLFYMRAGESFVPIPHAVLSGMFGKRPNPDLIINFTTTVGDPKVLDDGYIKFSIGISLFNRGRGMARNIFINHYTFGPGGNQEIAWEITDNQFKGYKVFGIGSNLIADESVRLAPEQRMQPIVDHFKLKPPFDQDLTLQITAGAEDQAPTKIEITHTKEELQEYYDNFIKDNSCDFMKKFLKNDKFANEE